MKWWQVVLIIFAGLFVLGGIISAIEEGSYEATKEIQQKTARPAPKEEVEDVEDYTVEPRKEKKSVVEIYDNVSLGMTEDEVREIAGEPEMTSQADVEGFGNMLELIYSNGDSLDNVTIMFEDGVVTMMVLGKFDGERLDVKSKM